MACFYSKLCIELIHFMDSATLLTHLGLSDKQANVYVALLNHGASTVTDIAKHAELYRTDVYRAVGTLLERGFVSKTKKKKRVLYKAESPAKLKSLVQDLTDSFSEQLPLLEQQYRAQKKRPTVSFHESYQGIQSVYDDIIATLPRGGVFYRYSSSKFRKPRNRYVSRSYEKNRDEKKIERYVITSQSAKARKKPKLERYMKIIPPDFDLFEYNITQLVYGDKVAFVDYNTDTATVIENPTIASFQRQLFKLLFSKL